MVNLLNNTALNSCVNQVITDYNESEEFLSDPVKAKECNFKIRRLRNYGDRLIKVAFNRNPDTIQYIKDQRISYHKDRLYHFKFSSYPMLPVSKFKPTKITVYFSNSVENYDTNTADEFSYIVNKLREAGVEALFIGKNVVDKDHSGKPSFFRKYMFYECTQTIELP